MALIDALSARSGTRWPPDDTEESVVGTDRHQMSILNLRLGINEIAQVLVGPGQPVQWRALSQTMLTGFTRPDGSRYKTRPDIYVYPRPLPQDRESFSLLVEGPPSLIIEVASESTYENELDLTAGKAWSYERAQVPEYLAIDPTGILLSAPGRAWRLVDGRYQPWDRDSAGLWWSEQLPLGFGVADGLVTVYDQARQRQLREGEIMASFQQMDAELQRKDAELSHKDQEIARLRRMLEVHERR